LYGKWSLNPGKKKRLLLVGEENVRSAENAPPGRSKPWAERGDGLSAPARGEKTAGTGGRFLGTGPFFQRYEKKGGETELRGRSVASRVSLMLSNEAAQLNSPSWGRKEGAVQGVDVPALCAGVAQWQSEIKVLVKNSLV